MGYDKIKKYICFDNLPKYQKGEPCGNIGTTNWSKSGGYELKGVYANIEFTLKILKYNKENKRVLLEYNDKEFEISIANLKGCRLGKLFNIYDFKIENGTRIKDNRRDLTIIDRKKILGNNKYYKYKCNKCGFDGGKHYSSKDKKYKDELWVIESSLISSQANCSCCGGSQIVVENINSIYHTDPWMIPIVGEEIAKTHTHGSDEKVQVTCPDCGKIKSKLIKISMIYNTHSMGCSCSDGISYPNKFAYELLNELNKAYKFNYLEHEYSPEWIGRKRYDNYFIYKGKEYILEMDGGLGHGKTIHSKDKKTKEESKAIDNYKDEQAKLHGIEVIRIDCDYKANDSFYYIKQKIFESKLNTLFDLYKVNWINIEKYSLSNLVKVVCTYKKYNSSYTTTEIGNIMGIGRGCVRKYLIKGSSIGWCEYNSKEELTKSAKKHSKKVIIFKDKIMLNIFESGRELERQSEKLFGIKLQQASISEACCKNKPYKEYHFKYIKDLTPKEYVKYDIENKLKELHNRELVQAC
jgi:predicted RNA-binding Zn-ribbon protein involved in translation (DUF1610 family)